MIRIYCDSNVYRILKPSHPSYTKELHETFVDITNNFIFPFSDAHLDDLKDSKEDFREIDLKFMEMYVKDNYFLYDHIKEKRIECYLSTPRQAFGRKDYNAAKNAMLNPFDFDHLVKDLDNSPEIKALSSVLNSFLDIPIAALGVNIDNSAIDKRSKEFLDKMMPGFHPMMTLKELMNSLTPFGTGLLQDDKKVSELRKFISEYMNRDDYSFDKWGLRFNEKFKETGFGKTFLETIDSMLANKNQNDFYSRFTHAYSMLEMYNITQERKSSGGLKKFDFESLSTDAMHAYYACFCDYLVTDDKGLQVKANIVYQLFGVQTKVLSTRDLLNLRTQLAGQEETLDKFIETFNFDLKHSLQLYDKVDIASGDKIQTYKTNHIYFNYFNRLQKIGGDHAPLFALYCDRGANGNFVMFREIELIVKKLNTLFGLDIENKGAYSILEEKDLEISKPIRSWEIGNLSVSVGRSQLSRGEFLYLSLQLKQV